MIVMIVLIDLTCAMRLPGSTMRAHGCKAIFTPATSVESLAVSYRLEALTTTQSFRRAQKGGKAPEYKLGRIDPQRAPAATSSACGAFACAVSQMPQCRSMESRSVAGTLYIVSTPIGNLEDITHRALRILREVNMVACEDTRHTRKLLNHFALDADTISYHEHNERERAD